MAKLIFIIDEEENREASKIEFEVPNDMDVWEYKRMCMRMAGAMGYTSLSIRKSFGIEYKKDLDNELKELYSNVFSGSLVHG
jgi:hypothetical protein